jgi:hypothetical protein
MKIMTDVSHERPEPRAGNGQGTWDRITIPRQVLEDWVAIPADDYVDVRLTRRDLDRLYSVFDELAAAQRALAGALIDWSHDRHASAEQNLTASFAHGEGAIS